jgi:hypothetical protein
MAFRAHIQADVFTERGINHDDVATTTCGGDLGHFGMNIGFHSFTVLLLTSLKKGLFAINPTTSKYNKQQRVHKDRAF